MTRRSRLSFLRLVRLELRLEPRLGLRSELRLEQLVRQEPLVQRELLVRLERQVWRKRQAACSLRLLVTITQINVLFFFPFLLDVSFCLSQQQN